MQVRITGQGDVGRNGGPAGNLYVQVNVREHKVFGREEFDLIYDLPIDMVEAALGVEKDIPTLDGTTKVLRIPQGTQPGSEFRIKGMGVPHIHSNRRGDLRVLVDLKVPKKLDARQQALLTELAESFGHNGATAHQAPEEESTKNPVDSDPDPEQQDNDKGIFDRIKDAFG